MEPVISVIVPIYKVEAYLPACVESILAQSYQNFELVLVDDGSPDGCPALCDAYAAQDSRVRVIHQKNGGLSAARNSGIDAARGDYIAFVDSDDWVRANYIEVLYTLLSQTKSDMAQCGFERVWTDEEPAIGAATVRCYTGQETCELSSRCLYSDLVIACNKLYAKDLFAEIRFPEGRIHEDEATTYRLFWQAQKVAVTTQCLYFYRQRPGSIMSSPISFARMDQITAMEERADFFALRHRPDLSTRAKLNLCHTAHANWALARNSGQIALAKRMRAKFKTAYPSVMQDRTFGTTIRWKLRIKRYCPVLLEWGKRLLRPIRGKD